MTDRLRTGLEDANPGQQQTIEDARRERRDRIVGLRDLVLAPPPEEAEDPRPQAVAELEAEAERPDATLASGRGGGLPTDEVRQDFQLAEDVLVRGVLGGGREALVNTANALQSFGEMDPLLDSIIRTLTGTPQSRERLEGAGVPEGRLPEAGSGAEQETPSLAERVVPEVEDPETTPGRVARPVTQFLSLFVPFTAGSKLLGLGGRTLQGLKTSQGVLRPAAGYALEGAGSGAAADFFAFAPNEERLANTLQAFGVRSRVIDELAATEDEGEFEGRLKNVVEGLAAGGVAGPALGFVGRGLRAARSAVRTQRAATVDVPRGAAEDVILARDHVISAREHAQLLEEIGPAIDDLDATAFSEFTDALARNAPETELQTREFLRTELPRLREDGRRIQADANSRLSETIDNSDLTDEQLREVMRPIWERLEDGPARAREREAFESLIEARGPRNPLADDQGAAEVAGLRAEGDEVFDATGAPIGRAEVKPRLDEALPGQFSRAAAEAPRVSVFGNRLEIPEETMAGFLRAFREGDFDGAASALGDSLDNTNFSKIVDNPEGIQDLLASIAREFRARPGSVRKSGVRTFEDTQERAEQILNEEAARFATDETTVRSGLERLLPDVTDLDAQITAVRLFETALSGKISRLSQDVVAGTASKTQESQLVQLGTLLANFNDRRSGAVTGIARALNAMKIPADGEADAVDALLQATVGGSVGARKFAEAIVKGGPKTPRHILEAQRRRALRGQIITEHMLGNMLLGPQTFSVNLVSNTISGFYLPLTKMLSGAISRDWDKVVAASTAHVGWWRGMLTAVAGTERFQAALKQAEGRGGIARLLRSSEAPAALRAVRTGQPITTTRSQVDQPTLGAITPENVADAFPALRSLILNPDGVPRSVPRTLINAWGKHQRIASRALLAADEVAKAGLYSAHVQEQAILSARRAGLQGQDADQFIDETMRNVGRFDAEGLDPNVARELKRIHEEAVDFADYGTFTSELPARTLGRSMQDLARQHPLVRATILPFVRVSVNLLKFAADNSIAAPVLKKNRDGFRAGDPDTISRFLLGTAMTGAAAWLASAGRIRGHGPSRRTARGRGVQESQRQARRLQNSIVLERADGTEQYVSIERGDPFATVFLAAADFVDLAGKWDEQTREQRALELVSIVTENFLDKTYFRGLHDAIGALWEPSRYATTFISRTAATALAPNYVRQIKRVLEPTVPQPDKTSTAMEFGTRTMQGLPAEGLLRDFANMLVEEKDAFNREPFLNIWGEEVEYPLGVGPDIVSPFWSFEESESRVRQTVADLEVPLNMSSLFGSMRVSNAGSIRLSPQQRNAWIEATAKPRGQPSLEDALANLIDSPDFQQLSAEPAVFSAEDESFMSAQAQRVRDVVLEHRQMGRAQMIAEDTELAERVRELKLAANVARENREVEERGQTEENVQLEQLQNVLRVQ